MSASETGGGARAEELEKSVAGPFLGVSFSLRRVLEGDVVAAVVSWGR